MNEKENSYELNSFTLQIKAVVRCGIALLVSGSVMQHNM